MSSPRSRSFTRWMRSLALVGGLAVSFFAGAALAADSKLDEAQAALTKAIDLLKKSEGQGEKFEQHRQKAVDLLTRAQGEVVKAKSE
jgi:hypothetical protein